MQFVFLDMAGKTLFVRDDAQRAIWTVEEYNLEIEFPYDSGRVVTTGQRVFFKDPATKAHQLYEVKQAKTYQPEGYQEVVAEHICVSELSDEHIDEKEITNKTCADAVTTVLSGTLWTVGARRTNRSSADISRGSVWQAILQIKSNWNVYIEPRVTLAADGTITRHLDISDTSGTWNGVRFSIDKNMLDPSVTYDDSETYTALYGYGGTISSSDPDEKNKECDFSEVVWTKTSEHPAKPKGQKYLEDKTATAAYGRNGRARFGYYQNNDITDAQTLLEKTWETLQTVSTPQISVEGTVADLYRLGYADQPLRLHDTAIVEIRPLGFKKQIQISRLSVDLIDPTATTLTIGAYIPNIIYINRETNEEATGTKGGGGKNTADDSGWKEFRTSIQQINNNTALRLQSVHNDVKNQEEEIAVQTGRIDVAYDKISAEVTDRRNADTQLSGRIDVQADRITAEVSQRTAGETTLSSRITQEAGRITLEVTNRKNADSQLSSRITQTAESISAEVTRAKGAEGTLSGRIDVQADRISLVVSGTGDNAKIKPAAIVASINGSQSSVIISANKVNLDGYVTASMLETAFSDVDQMTVNQLTVSQSGYFTCLGHNTEWKTLTFTRITAMSTDKYFLYGTSPTSTSGSGAIHGKIVTDSASTTIHYLGY